MNTTYPINSNPICPNDGKDCHKYDMDNYLDCNICTRSKK